MTFIPNHPNDKILYAIAASDNYTAECIRMHIHHSFPGLQVEAILEDSDAILSFENFDTLNFIISDVSLVDGSAFDAFRQKGVVTPIIFFGAYEPQHYSTHNLNVAGFLLKPPVRKEIEEIILTNIPYSV